MLRRTRPAVQPIAQRFPELLKLQRTAVRLHPHRVADPLPLAASKIGGRILWPDDELWPICSEREYALKPLAKTRTAVHSYGHTWVEPGDRRHSGVHIPVLQLRRDDVPELPFPGDSDLFQLICCSRLHDDDLQPRIRLYWRRERDISHPRTSFPQPVPTNVEGTLVNALSPDYLLPLHECAVSPERMDEYPSLVELEEMGMIPDEMSAELWDAENRGELGTAHGGTKVGGWPCWEQGSIELTCSRGHAMRYLLSFEAYEPIDELILSPDEQEVWSRLNAREKTEYLEPTGMHPGRNGFLYVFWCPRCLDHPARSDSQ